MNIYDRIAVKALVSYLADYENPKRDKLIASMKSDHEVFVEILKAAVKKYRGDYDGISQSHSYQRYIRKEYSKHLDVIETSVYYDYVPEELFYALERSF